MDAPAALPVQRLPWGRWAGELAVGAAAAARVGIFAGMTQNTQALGKQRDARGVAVAQGAYWLASGVWPLVNYRSFEAVTGPKREPWLVKAVGALVSVVGATLLYAGLRRQVTGAIRLLGAGTAAALGGVDAYYSARRRISPVYAADAVLEAGLLWGWLQSGGVQRVSPRALHEKAQSGGCWDIAPGETWCNGQRDVVEEGLLETFPASDPTSYQTGYQTGVRHGPKPGD